MHRFARLVQLLSTAGLFTAVACNGVGNGPTAPTTPSASSTAIIGVAPRGGATNVATTAGITLTFNHPMMAGMQFYMALHVDSLTGHLVSGTMTWSSDHTQLTFSPTVPLHAQTTYVLHVGGGMMDANASAISYSQCQGLGGQWVTGSMMGGGMMGGRDEMGSGWQGSNGDFGVEFVFTTG